MRAVVQKVLEANVEIIDQHELNHISHIDLGLLVLLGVEAGDTEQDVRYMADKLANMRVFADADGKMNLSVRDVGGHILLISQFTLFGDLRHGRRPSFSTAATPQTARALYHNLTDRLIDMGLPVKNGHFQTHMHVSLTNDGPVTLLLDSRKTF